MPLVAPLDRDADPDVAELAAFFNETLGFPPNSVLTMQRRPEIAKAFINLNKAVMRNDGAVTSEQKRLIGYIASLTAGCRYCQAHTALAAERYGASEDRVRNIWNYEGSALYTPAEKAAFAFAQAA
ncbi:MAG: carboxymuconolactone decarboxylase family protein, partial [Pseudomonadota bacterium]